MIYACFVSPANPPDDLEVLRAQKDDKQALDALIVKTTPYVFSLCKTWARPPLDPSDVAQDSMIRIVKNLKSFRGGSEFFTWVYTVTYRTFLDTARKQKRRASIAPMESIDENTNVANLILTEDSNNSDMSEKLSKALEALDPVHVEILILIDVRGTSYEQTAKDLGIAIGTVRSRLSRARISLRKTLVSQGTFDEFGNVLINEEPK